MFGYVESFVQRWRRSLPMKLVNFLTLGLWGLVAHSVLKSRIPQVQLSTRKFACSLCRTVTSAYVEEPMVYRCNCSYCGLPNEFDTNDPSQVIKGVPGKITLGEWKWQLLRFYCSYLVCWCLAPVLFVG
jgi:hypothetical protein